MNAIVLSHPTGYCGTAIKWGSSVYDHYFLIKAEDGSVTAVDERNVTGYPPVGARGELTFVPRGNNPAICKPLFVTGGGKLEICNCGDAVTYDGMCDECNEWEEAMTR